MNHLAVYEALSEEYRGVAFTPSTKVFSTASVMWVSNRASLMKMNERIFEVMRQPRRYRGFLYKVSCRPKVNT